ncbi:MAG TPA: hypothetical protein VKV95_11545 [Terriglobia bacterium]|nr:hypothetical protein [Terriglobia bacterium]
MKLTCLRFVFAFSWAILGLGNGWAQVSKTPKGPVPEISGVTPNSVPPGGSGDLVITGKNLAPGVSLRIGCKDSRNAHIDSFKIESPARAVAHVTLPESVPEGPCDVYLEFVRGPGSEILPSVQGTPEVVQVKSVNFGVSNSSTSMPVGLGEFSLVPDDDLKALATMDAAQASAQKMADDVKSGKVNPMDPDFMKKMQEAAMQMGKMAQQGQKFAQDGVKGELLLRSGSVSFVQEGKTIFNQPISKVQDITQIQDPMGSSYKIFRLAFSDGKVYGLRAPQSSPAKLDNLKKKLGK